MRRYALLGAWRRSVRVPYWRAMRRSTSLRAASPRLLAVFLKALVATGRESRRFSALKAKHVRKLAIPIPPNDNCVDDSSLKPFLTVGTPRPKANDLSLGIGQAEGAALGRQLKAVVRNWTERRTLDLLDLNKRSCSLTVPNVMV